ncbi:MAG: hypothetical protein AAF581_00020 [Planctomycetota bacterium]
MATQRQHRQDLAESLTPSKRSQHCVHAQLRLLICIVSAVALFVVPACNTGGRGTEIVPIDPPESIDVTGVTPDEGSAGTVVTISGHGFNLDPTMNEVLFVQNGPGTARVAGQILTVTSSGTDEYGRLVTAMTVRAPTNLHTSTINVSVFDGDDFVFAGARDFLATPVITAVVYGATNAGSGIANIINDTVADLNVILYGYNLSNVVGAIATDENAQPVNVMAMPGLPAGAPAPPPGVTAATVFIPAGTPIAFPNCVESAMVQLQVQTAGNTAVPLVSNRVLIKFRKRYPSGALDDLHGSVTSLVVPSGVRAGQIECEFNLHADADGSSAVFDVTPQYLDPAGTYVDCTVVDGPVQVLPGKAVEPASAAIQAAGHKSSFIWDSGADLPLFEGVTQLRLLVEQTGNTFLCDQAADGEFVSAPIAIANTGASGLGSIFETFRSERYLDDNATDNGVWVVGSGQAEGIGDPATAPSLFGAGTVDVFLEDGIAYTIDTDAGIIVVDDINLGLPTPLTDAANPGALLHELHVRSLTIEPGAIVTVVGEFPVVFRVSGSGVAGETVVQVDGVLDLSGEDGQDGTDVTPGAGGIGIAGGGNGGTGAQAIAGALDIQDIVPATSGTGPGAGQFGRSTSWLSASVATARGGPGGGAGHAAAGLDGVSTNTSNAIAKAQPGRGGSAYGDSLLVHLSPGSGGGGGGTGIRYVPSSQVLSDKTGGGGGAGGGAIEIVADGVVEIGGSIICDGGAGGLGAPGPYGAQGGAGSGGSIAIRATQGLRIADDAVLTARGRPGTQHNNSSTTWLSGGSSDGRIHLESNGPSHYAGFHTFTGLEPPLSDSAVRTGVSALQVNVGSGGDGTLNLSSAAVGATWVVDSGATSADRARVFDEAGTLVLVAGQPGGVIELTTLIIPEQVTLRVWGGNPLTLRVTGAAKIDGTIDVSGGPGGLIDDSGSDPIAGAGGRAGPGGGDGGSGGIVSGSANVIGGIGTLPHSLPPELLATSPYSAGPQTSAPVPAVPALPAYGGRNVIGGSALDAASSGGGGGFGHPGNEGAAGNVGATTVAGGGGGSAYLNNDFIQPGTLATLLAGGAGGGGGGASDFSDLQLAHAPGTGGGGGGGCLQISVGGAFDLNATAQLLARGGDAFRATQWSGNGGGGAGGAIRLQGLSEMRINGAVISVAGGQANRPVADHPDPAQVIGASYIENSGELGGIGGSGRIQIESPFGINSEPAASCAVSSAAGICPAPTSGSFFLADAGTSVGQSLTYHVSVTNGVYPGHPQFHLIRQDPGTPPGDTPRVLSFMRGASEDRARPGTIGEFGPWTDSPSTLRNTQYVQLKHIFVARTDSAGMILPQILEEVEVLFDY